MLYQFSNYFNEMFKEYLTKILEDKKLIIYILIGMIIVYFMYNIFTTTIKYPIVIILGIIIGKKIKDYFDK